MSINTSRARSCYKTKKKRRQTDKNRRQTGKTRRQIENTAATDFETEKNRRQTEKNRRRTEKKPSPSLLNNVGEEFLKLAEKIYYHSLPGDIFKLPGQNGNVFGSCLQWFGASIEALGIEGIGTHVCKVQL